MVLDSGKGVILVPMELSAAFVTTDHEMLVSRLQTRFGIQCPALQWCRSYLLDCYQVIHVSGEASYPVGLIYGVPRRSVLGTLECIAYMCPISGIQYTSIEWL